MKRVCLVNWPSAPEIGGFAFECFDPQSHFGLGERLSLRDLITDGWNGYNKRRLIRSGADAIEKLYRRRDPAYMRMVDEFVARFRDFDLIVMGYNFVHPDVLATALSKPTKILGFIDDPYSTYRSGIPFLWAFDGAFHISPSYNERWLFSEAFTHWGCKAHYWWPLTQPLELPERGVEYFERRDVDLVYVGNPHPNKLGRLARLKKRFGSRFHVHGRWRLQGFAGWTGLISGKPVYLHRVTPLSSEDRTRLYMRASIGFNMHVSEDPAETGNLRMYELPAHGVMQVCDKAGRDAHATIFEPDREAVFYDDLADAIERIEYYLAHPLQRIDIARAGYERVRRDYDYLRNFAGFLDWAISLKPQLVDRGS